MSKFIELHYADDEGPVLINIGTITTIAPSCKYRLNKVDGKVKEIKEEDGVLITLTDGYSVHVKESYEEIMYVGMRHDMIFSETAVYDDTFECDPEKAVGCKKTFCHINGGPCKRTTNIEYRKENENGRCGDNH